MTGAIQRSSWHCDAERAFPHYSESVAGYISKDPCTPAAKHWEPRRADQCFMDRVEDGDPEAVALMRGPGYWQRFVNWFKSMCKHEPIPVAAYTPPDSVLPEPPPFPLPPKTHTP